MSERDGYVFRPINPPGAAIVCAQVIIGVLPLAQVIVGAVYQNECPRQPYIPVYLLVMGAVFLLMNVLSVLPCCTSFGIYKIWICVVSLFVFCWFIAGNVWIYSIYEPNYNKTGSSMDTYYNKTGSSMNTYDNKTGSSMDTYDNKTGSSMDTYDNKTGSSMDTYCNKTLYLWAFWTTNLTYILLGFTICCKCLLCVAG